MSSYIRLVKRVLNDLDVKFTEPQEDFLRIKSDNPINLVGLIAMHVGGWGIGHSGLEYKIKRVPEQEIFIYKWDFVIQKKWQHIWRKK